MMFLIGGRGSSSIATKVFVIDCDVLSISLR